MFISEKKILKKPIPQHLAIILDGNGRWAKKRGLPRSLGHYNGAINLAKIAQLCDKYGVKYLTVYCFSTENWKRPKEEVEYLMQEPVKQWYTNKDKIIESNIVIKVIGRRDRFPQDTLKMILEMEESTKNNTGLTLVIAADYGSQTEITEAAKKITQQVVDDKIKIEDINSELIENNLYTACFPKLDLLIRTSGEVRISNFLLWQLSYAELYFAKCYWPSFNKRELLKAFKSYQSRNRRFGGLNEVKK